MYYVFFFYFFFFFKKKKNADKINKLPQLKVSQHKKWIKITFRKLEFNSKRIGNE